MAGHGFGAGAAGRGSYAAQILQPLSHTVHDNQPAGGVQQRRLEAGVRQRWRFMAAHYTNRHRGSRQGTTNKREQDKGAR